MEKLPEAVQRLLDEFSATNHQSANTKSNYYKTLLSYCRITGAASLDDLCNQNLTKWHVALTQEGYAPSSIALYAMNLRNLYTHIMHQQGLKRGQAALKAAELFEAIPLGALRKAAAKANQLRDKIVTPTEFTALVNAADHPRVRAFLVMLYESGARPDELLGLRIRDVEFRDRFIQIRVYGKTGERTIPLVRSIPYLRTWLLVHPKKADPDAPLFIRPYHGKLKQVTLQGFQSTFKHLKQKASITRRIHLYLFRHTRLTDLAKHGLGDFQMKAFAGWTKDSRMPSIYIHLSGRDCLAPILELEGIQIEKAADPGVKSPIRLKVCPRCGSPNEADAAYCNHCNLILDDKTLHDQIQLETQTDKVMDAVINHPLVRNAIREALEGLKASGKLPIQVGG